MSTKEISVQEMIYEICSGRWCPGCPLDRPRDMPCYANIYLNQEKYKLYDAGFSEDVIRRVYHEMYGEISVTDDDVLSILE